MFRNYLLVALRNLRRQKATAFINIAGLALGLAVCFVIGLWVHDELRHDRFHVDADRIHRVLWDARFGDNEWTIPLGGAPVAQIMREELPEVEHIARLFPSPRVLRQDDMEAVEERFFYADSTIFDVLTINLIAGDRRTALRHADAVIVSDETSRRLFGTTAALGRTVELADGTALRVTGVAEAMPAHSHFHFDFLAPAHGHQIYGTERWAGISNAAVYTYFKLRPDADPSGVEARLNGILAERFEMATLPASGESYSRMLFQPLTDIHLRSNLEYELQPGGSITYVYLFGLIGVFILLLAGVNYVNLTTAQSERRRREVGVRKSLGSPRKLLVAQFLVESFLSVAAAAVLALAIVWLSMPGLNELSGKALSVVTFGVVETVALALLVALVVTAVAGAYPAFFLSGFRPMHALRGEASGMGGRRLRSTLVVGQFAVCIGLIASTLVVHAQMRFLQEHDPGFDREHVLVIRDAGALGDQQQAFTETLRGLPQVVSAAATTSVPGQTFDSTLFEPEQPANYESTSLTYAFVDAEYVDVLGLRVVEGRAFSAERGTDQDAFMINRAAAAALGWDQPVGRRLTFGGWISGPVVGVVEDFNYRSLHHEVQPIVLLMPRWPAPYIAVRLDPTKPAQGIAAVRAAWREFLPARSMEYTFVDEYLTALYDAERRMAAVFNLFAGLAILVACLGLFGLAAYAAERRTREIGVRKVLGATVAGLVGLLSKDFLKLIAVAFLLAAPLAYLGMQRWLEGFAYRIDVGPGVLIAAGFLAAALALVAASYHSLRAATVDPVKALRTEA